VSLVPLHPLACTKSPYEGFLLHAAVSSTFNILSLSSSRRSSLTLASPGSASRNLKNREKVGLGPARRMS
jgi:hypothetical protein